MTMCFPVAEIGELDIGIGFSLVCESTVTSSLSSPLSKACIIVQSKLVLL